MEMAMRDQFLTEKEHKQARNEEPPNQTRPNEPKKQNEMEMEQNS